VASYQDEKEAQNLSAQLKSKGYNSFYVQAHVNSQTWFRVCVGPLFTTLKQADDFKKDILSKKVVTSAIIQKIDKQ
jgi:cell division protein FtsN